MTTISVIIPCYFNEGNIAPTVAALRAQEKSMGPNVRFQYIFVDDGSGDRTWAELQKAKRGLGSRMKIVRLSRNFGANQASFCGLHEATGDVNIILAADLQEPPELIGTMFTHWKKGYKLVVARMAGRHDGPSTDIVSRFFHFLVKTFIFRNYPEGGVNTIMFDRQVREDILGMNEKNLFIPQLVFWLGYEFVSVPYEKRKREIGVSRWTLSKRIKASIDIFVGFSYLPIRIITVLGFGIGGMAFLYGASVLLNRLLNRIPVGGWSSMMVVLLFATSFQMIALGIIGEYVWRALDAARNRPNYVVDRKA